MFIRSYPTAGEYFSYLFTFSSLKCAIYVLSRVIP